MRLLSIFALGACLLEAQTTSVSTGAIQGKLLDAKTSKPVPAAWVIANRKTAPPLSKHTKSGGDGSFSIQGLTAVTYTVCIQAADESYLNPCGLGGSASTVTVTAGQSANAGSLRLSPASLLTVNVQDATGVLTQLLIGSRQPDLLIGVRSPSGIFYPAHPRGGKLTSSIAAVALKSYVYQVAVPFDTQMNVSIASHDLKLGDANGVALPANASTQAFQHATGAVTAQSFTFSVLGLKP